MQEFFGCKKPFFKIKKRDYEYGEVQPFTKSGSKAYEKMIGTLYAIERIVENEQYSKCLNDVINKLDEICDK